MRKFTWQAARKKRLRSGNCPSKLAACRLGKRTSQARRKLRNKLCTSRNKFIAKTAVSNSAA